MFSPKTVKEIARSGFALIPEVMNASDREALLAVLGPVSGAGQRGLLGIPAVAALARSERWLELIRPNLPGEPLPVRALYFDKSEESNWGVSWHQDLTIAVAERVEVAGFSAWSVKEGIPHVQPPVNFLKQMLTIRLHLDDADDTNGALRVLPGSHRQGRLNEARIEEWRSTGTEHLCVAAAGDALLIRPLLLHASSRSTSTGHRRVLHIEYAGFALPEALRWHEAA